MVASITTDFKLSTVFVALGGAAVGLGGFALTARFAPSLIQKIGLSKVAFVAGGGFTIGVGVGVSHALIAKVTKVAMPPPPPLEADQYGRTAMHGAITEKTGIGEIRRLIEVDSRYVTQADEDGQTPLHQALRGVGRNEEIALLLVESGADICAKDRDDRTPLGLAFSASNRKVVEAMVERLTDLNIVVDGGGTPLQLAVGKPGWEGVVARLIERGADCNRRDSEQDTVIHNVIIGFHRGSQILPTFEALVKGGAELGARNSMGHTPWDVCLLMKHAEMIDVLIRLKAGLEFENARGETPLCVATKLRNASLVSELLDAGACPTTALSQAIRHSPDMATLFFEKGADFTASGSSGPYLFELIEKGGPKYFALAQQIIESGVGIKLTESNGWTTLHVVADDWPNDTIEAVVQSLVRQGADLKATTADGRTPLQVAQGEGLNRSAELLKLLATDGSGKNL